MLRIIFPKLEEIDICTFTESLTSRILKLLNQVFIHLELSDNILYKVWYRNTGEKIIGQGEYCLYFGDPVKRKYIIIRIVLMEIPYQLKKKKFWLNQKFSTMQ